MNSTSEHDKAKQYLRDLTSGGLLLAESRIVAETLMKQLSETDWTRLFTEENILQKNSKQTAIRYARTIKRRFNPLGKDFIAAVIPASDSQYQQMLLLAMMIHTPVLPDFMQTVVAETKRVYKPNLASDAWDVFLHDRSRILPTLYNLSEATLKKSGNNVIRALVEAGYLDNNKNRRLQPVYLLPETKIWLNKLNREDLEPLMECTL